MKDYIKIDQILHGDRELTSDEFDSFIDAILDVVEKHGLKAAGNFQQMTEEEVLEG